MRKTLTFASTLLLFAATAADAQTTPVPVVTTASAPDPARLAAARQVIDLIIPPADRDQMVDRMVKPIMIEMRQTFSQMPFYQQSVAANPAVAERFNKFLDARQEKMFVALRTNLPGMIEALSRAYARRFDLKELGDIRAFFETPSGRVYAASSFTLMQDPDILTWQRQLMTSQMADMQQDIATFFADLPASTPAEPKQ
jgi:hypothetical protein